MNLQEVTHKARREHICSQCGRRIHEGEVYVKAPRPGAELVAPAKFHQDCYRKLQQERS